MIPRHETFNLALHLLELDPAFDNMRSVEIALQRKMGIASLAKFNHLVNTLLSATTVEKHPFTDIAYKGIKVNDQWVVKMEFEPETTES